MRLHHRRQSPHLLLGVSSCRKPVLGPCTAHLRRRLARLLPLRLGKVLQVLYSADAPSLIVAPEVRRVAVRAARQVVTGSDRAVVIRGAATRVVARGPAIKDLVEPAVRAAQVLVAPCIRPALRQLEAQAGQERDQALLVRGHAPASVRRGPALVRVRVRLARAVLRPWAKRHDRSGRVVPRGAVVSSTPRARKAR